MQEVARSVGLVDVVEALVRDGAAGQIEIPVVHRFADGLYAREITFPAGTIATSRVHKTRTISIISKGIISVWSARRGVQHLEAPFTFVGEPGERFIGFAHEETVWTCVHATTETDLAKIEEQLIEPMAEPVELESALKAFAGEASWLGLR